MQTQTPPGTRATAAGTHAETEAAPAGAHAETQAATAARARLQATAALKRRICEQARVAVSDCLQVLGGYGYMEEYRLEKRLRDALTLEALWPGPAGCDRLVAAELFREEQGS